MTINGRAPRHAGEAWEICEPVAITEGEDSLLVRAMSPPAPGSERGLVTVSPHESLALSFEVLIPRDACFIAKLNQSSKLDQLANSYHLYCDGGGAYLARHHCVFKTLDVPRETWLRLRLGYADGWLWIDESNRRLHTVRDPLLPGGHAFLGVKRGSVQLRNVGIAPPGHEESGATTLVVDGDTICPPHQDLRPRVSIVTTVYDRVECLEQCVRTVRAQRYGSYEHVIVSDAPPLAIVQRIAALVRSFSDARLSYVNLAARHNNWGIAPAAAGLRRSRGEFVCFLSDDNGYTPDHLGTLVEALDRDDAVGFVYSSCHYGGRLVLRHPHPAPARIDLGQPMFRRSLFTTHLADDLPFETMAWDWALVDTLMNLGVRWKHVDVPSFVFRLARYPRFWAP